MTLSIKIFRQHHISGAQSINGAITQPDFDSPEQCVKFGKILRDICRHLGVSECVMQRGHMRFEPNINVVIDKDGSEYRTPIVEIKNLNSFKALHGAVAFEYRRQVEQWIETGRVQGAGEKSTRGWDDARSITVLQREKEDAHDYRYFPDPDLVPLEVDDEWIERLRGQLGEMPLARRHRYLHDLGLNNKDADALIEQPQLCRFYEQV